ncbi:ATP-binding protein [Coraliomargarita sinensis]|nr:ATP-binding protein [Coraliomargarita sinensis]
MNCTFLRTGVKYILVALTAAFASQIAVALADVRYDERVNHIAPIFGIAISIVLVGGYRYLPAIFIGAVIPGAVSKVDTFSILSAPMAAVAAAALARRVLDAIRVDVTMERVRDAFLMLFWAAGVATFAGALIQSLFLCSGPNGIPFKEFWELSFSNWLSAAVGTIIVAPFVQTWANPVGFRLGSKQLVEVFIWFVALICFGHVTFKNWAPTDTLLYPMELAIFPIMAWSAFRFGLRGASAGVLALALLAGWELVPVLQGQGESITQSPANVWFFVGIVSVTSVCLAAVMTELRRREAQISENEMRLRAFTEALPDIAFVLSASGTIHDVFAATDRICANHRIFNADSVRGKKISDLFNDKVCAEFIDTIKETLRSGRVSTLEYSLQSVDVGVHWFEARVTPMANSEEQNDQVVWVAYDISSRKSSEEAIRHRDTILRATAHANNCLLTTSGFEDAIEAALSEIGRALSVDRAFIFRVSGSDHGEFHNFAVKYEWQKRDEIPSLLSNPSLQNAPFEQYCPHWYESLVEDGIVKVDFNRASDEEVETLRVFQARAILAIPMWKEGSLYGFFGVDHCEQAHDWNESEINAVRLLASGLSGLIMIEENQDDLRLAKDTANAASVAKGEFLAMMSHEIRTPMNAIIGYTDLLFQSDLDQQQSEHAAIIKRSGRALLDLINNILDYSKIESRSLDLEAEQFDLEQIICEALEEVLPQAKDKNLRVDYEIDPNVREFYIGDAHRLRQILLNLSSNAIKFTSKGSITIRVSLKAIDSEHDSDVLHFEVIDTGHGIPKEKYEKLFQPFTQVDSSTTRRFGGTGLGLVISKRLVERMHGEIWIESELGAGSNFQFHVRLEHAASVPGAARKEGDAVDDEELLEPEFAIKNPLKLLLCEDDKDNRWVIRELLEMLGYRPDVVESSEEALCQLKNRSYDAVLMDVRLPGRSGIELTEAIRSGEEKVENQNQYIIAVTAYAMNEDRQKCLSVGMNDYIRKPVEIYELKEALKRASLAAQH